MKSKEELYKSVNDLAALGHYEVALELLEAELSGNPEDLFLNELKAKVLSQKGDFKAAGVAWDNVLKLSPENAEAGKGKALCEKYASAGKSGSATPQILKWVFLAIGCCAVVAVLLAVGFFFGKQDEFGRSTSVVKTGISDLTVKSTGNSLQMNELNSLLKELTSRQQDLEHALKDMESSREVDKQQLTDTVKTTVDELLVRLDDLKVRIGNQEEKLAKVSGALEALPDQEEMNRQIVDELNLLKEELARLGKLLEENN